MANTLTLKKELELLERMEQALVIDEKERRKLAEVLFDAPEIARDAIFCYYAALQRRVQVAAGTAGPPDVRVGWQVDLGQSTGGSSHSAEEPVPDGERPQPMTTPWTVLSCVPPPTPRMHCQPR